MIENALSILSYGCTSSAGATVAELWAGLCEGCDQSSQTPTGEFACLWPTRTASAHSDLVEQLLVAWRQAVATLDPATVKRVRAGERLGVIFASTKGKIDDLIAQGDERALRVDPYGAVLSDFLARAELKPVRALTVSNACASTLAAAYLARHWIAAGVATEVLVLAADRVGPFVLKGFQCLRALSPERVRPFAKDRSGLRLGDAAAALLFSSAPGPYRLDGVGLDAEGVSVTRPAAASLKRACAQLPRVAPDLILAHGTATAINDPIEDEVFHELYGTSALITATKWSVGHTLGASGAIDLIAACEALRHQQAFRIANTAEIDPAFKARYFSAQSRDSLNRIDRVLVSSLGFGGVHAAALLSRARLQ